VQDPIVIDVIRQPPVTPEITYPQVIVSAFSAAGLIMLVAALVGLLTGAVIIFLKRRLEASGASTESEHVRLRI
jgi:uncharacterized protein involved in exopolysaccharide biosynthesis